VQSHAIGYDFNYGFHPGGGNFVGFRFDSGAGYRYGYAVFNWNLATGTLTIPQWWYDDSGAAVQVVPEPSALALLAMGAAGLAAYRAPWMTPLSAPFRGHRVLTMPPPSGGGATLLQLLQVLGKKRRRRMNMNGSITRWTSSRRWIRSMTMPIM